MFDYKAMLFKMLGRSNVLNGSLLFEAIFGATKASYATDRRKHCTCPCTTNSRFNILIGFTSNTDCKLSTT